MEKKTAKKAMLPKGLVNKAIKATAERAGAAASLKGSESLGGRVGVNLAVDVGSLGAKHILSTQTKEDCPTKMLPTSGPAPADNTNTSIPYLEE